jgi:hypothetical protein
MATRSESRPEDGGVRENMKTIGKEYNLNDRTAASAQPGRLSVRPPRDECVRRARTAHARRAFGGRAGRARRNAVRPRFARQGSVRARLCSGSAPSWGISPTRPDCAANSRASGRFSGSRTRTFRPDGCSSQAIRCGSGFSRKYFFKPSAWKVAQFAPDVAATLCRLSWRRRHEQPLPRPGRQAQGCRQHRQLAGRCPQRFLQLRRDGSVHSLMPEPCGRQLLKLHDGSTVGRENISVARPQPRCSLEGLPPHRTLTLAQMLRQVDLAEISGSLQPLFPVRVAHWLKAPLKAVEFG